jgi:hypothetical protein
MRPDMKTLEVFCAFLDLSPIAIENEGDVWL